jgi:hypothetical protein
MSGPASEPKEANLMTRSCWLAACAAALLLGGGAARAQTSYPAPPNIPLPCPASEAVRAPYYNELPQIIFPPQKPVCPSSGPAIWARLFDAVARNCPPTVCQGNVVCEAHGRVSCNGSRSDDSVCRTVSHLLKMYRFYYQTGHYHAAQFMARRALQIDPGNVAADAALNMAVVAADAVARARGTCGDAEDCEAREAKESKCGACSKDCAGCCQAAAKACCQAAAACKACAARASCACGTGCTCAKEKSCACGEDCCCKKSAAQKVRHRRRQAVREVCPNPVPMMMCPGCPGCPTMDMLMPHPGAAVMAPPPHAMMPPPASAVMPCPVIPNGMAPTYQCPVPAQPERLAMPRLVSPAPVPTNITVAPAPVASAVPAATVERARGPIQIRVCGKQVLLSSPCLKACCDHVTSLPDGRALLEGNVMVTFQMPDRPAKVIAGRMIVDLEDGSYEVNPPRPQGQILKPVNHQEWIPAYKLKKALVHMLGEVNCKPCCPAPCKPCCPAPCKPCAPAPESVSCDPSSY